jgi:Flp pilus assembly protein TadG
MTRKLGTLLHRFLRNQCGAVAVWMLFLLPLIIGMGGLVLDIGNAFISYRQLQTTTDAAALAAAAQLPNSTNAIAAAYQYSACASCGSNSVSGYNASRLLNQSVALTNVTVTPTPGCVSITNLPSCGTSLTANAIRVTQTTTIPTYFIKILSLVGVQSAKSITLSTSAIAVMRGSQRGPYNVAIVLDTTASMAQGDGGSNCTGTKIQCAEQGAQIMLSQFSPCLPGTACGTATNGNVANPVDEVSLFTFPAQTAGSQVTNDEPCSSKQPSVISYPDSTTLGSYNSTTKTLTITAPTNTNALVTQYQVVPLSSNFRTSDSTTGTSPLTTSTTVSSTSPSIVNAVGGNSYFGGTGCTGMSAKGGVSTYYAGALFAAQMYLANNSRTNAQNVIILLSDGDANNASFNGSDKFSTGGNYPSNIDGCQQAYQIATAAKAAGTKIYTVGYGVASGGCESDSGDKTPAGNSWTACSALRDIASSDANFFVDTSSANSGDCAHATSVTMNGKTNTLSAIFTAIVGDLSLPRLVPSTYAFTAS